MNPREQDRLWMREALDLARQAASAGEVPVGAVVVHEQRVLAARANAKESLRNPCAHAEILALQDAAAALGRWRLSDCTLYSTLEPCVMCAGACVQARVGRLVFGAWDAKFGGVESLFAVTTDVRANHRCQVSAGILSEECAALLQEFFRDRRKSQKSFQNP